MEFTLTLLLLVLFSIGFQVFIMSINLKLFIAYNILVVMFLTAEWSPVILSGFNLEYGNAAGYVVGIFLLKAITIASLIGAPICYFLGKKLESSSESKNT